MGKRVYIAGPMRGIPRFNFRAFDEARVMIESHGGIAISPADMDRADGFNPYDLPDDHDWSDTESLGYDMRAALDRDVFAIQQADAIYMLDGWERSRGACAEHALACWYGKEDYYQTEPTESVLDEAVRITRGDRNADYGDPVEDFTRVAKMWEAYKGVEFSPHDVAWMMVFVKANRNRNKSKRDNYVDAAGYIDCGAKCEGFSQW